MTCNLDNHDLTPGWLAFIAIGDKQFDVTENEIKVLVAPTNSVSWVITRGSSMPRGAVQVGSAPGTGQPYYIGRVALGDPALVPGAILGSTIYAPYYTGRTSQVFEVLVDNSQI